MDKDDMDTMDFLKDDLDAANERIKVLEDALKTSLELCREIQSSHKASIGSLYSHYTPQLRVSTVTGQAAIISAALEVKT